MSYGKKIVNGEEVLLTAQEVAALEARDAQWTAKEPVRQAERDRVHGLTNDEQAQLMADRLANMTTQQIDNYFANNVNTPAQAINVLKNVCKILAVRLTPRGLGEV